MSVWPKSLGTGSLMLFDSEAQTILRKQARQQEFIQQVSEVWQETQIMPRSKFARHGHQEVTVLGHI
jgi:hypothetical protein